METAKEIFIKTIQDQPDDSTGDAILRELLFHQMILTGLQDDEDGETLTHEEFGKMIRSWAK